MCLTTPAQIISIQDQTAQVKNNHGKEQQVLIGAVEGVKVGDWVLVNANLAVEKVSEKEALELKQLIHK